MEGIKILKIGITDWLINTIRESKQHPDKSKNVWLLNEDKTIVEFSLTHKDFSFFIDFDIWITGEYAEGVDCEHKNYSHVSELYPESDMIDFDDNRLEEIYKAVLSHF